MRIVEKKVYYCDYCPARRMTKYSMEAHEGKCLYNQNRTCTAPYCANSIGTDQEHVDYAIDNIVEGGGIEGGSYYLEQNTIDEIREKVEMCPICTIAVLCIAKKQMKAKNESLYWDYDIKQIASDMYHEYMAENAHY